MSVAGQTAAAMIMSPTNGSGSFGMTLPYGQFAGQLNQHMQSEALEVPAQINERKSELGTRRVSDMTPAGHLRLINEDSNKKIDKGCDQGDIAYLLDTQSASGRGAADLATKAAGMQSGPRAGAKSGGEDSMTENNSMHDVRRDT